MCMGVLKLMHIPNTGEMLFIDELVGLQLPHAFKYPSIW